MKLRTALLVLLPSASVMVSGLAMSLATAQDRPIITLPTPGGGGAAPGGEGATKVEPFVTGLEGTDARTTPPGARVSFNLEDADLPDLVRIVSRITGKRFILPSKARSIKATVYSPSDVTAAEAYQAFLSILSLNGLSLEPSGRYYKIIETSGAESHGFPMYDDGEAMPADDRFVTRMHRVGNVSAEDVATLLSHFKSAEGAITAYAPTNTLIITDTAANVRRMLRIISEIDIPRTGEQIWVEPIHYAAATDLAERLREVYPVDDGELVWDHTRRDQGGPARRSQGTCRPRRRGCRSRCRCRELDHGGRCGGRRGAHTQHHRGRTHELPHHHGDRARLPRAARAHPGARRRGGRRRLRPRVRASVRRRREHGGGAGEPHRRQRQRLGRCRRGDQTRGGGRARRCRRGRGQLLWRRDQHRRVQGHERPHRDRVVPGLRRAQTSHLRARRGAETGLHRGGDHGAPGAAHLAARGQLPRRSARTERGWERRPLGAGLRRRHLARLSRERAHRRHADGLGARHTRAEPTFHPRHRPLDSQLRCRAHGAREQLGRRRAGHAALDRDGQHRGRDQRGRQRAPSDLGHRRWPRQPGCPGRGAGGAGAAAGAGGLAALAGLAGGGLGGGAGVQRQTVGITLRIIPHINDAGEIRLEIEEEISEAGAPQGTLGVVPIEQRTAKTQVLVRDQETVVIGGLMRDRVTTSETKIPILGDLPILGALFRTESRTTERRNLLLFLTPYIIRTPDDLRAIFERKMQERQEFLDRFFVFGDHEYTPPFDYSRTRGLVFEIFNELEDLDEERELEAELEARPPPEHVARPPLGTASPYDDSGAVEGDMVFGPEGELEVGVTVTPEPAPAEPTPPAAAPTAGGI